MSYRAKREKNSDKNNTVRHYRADSNYNEHRSDDLDLYSYCAFLLL